MKQQTSENCSAPIATRRSFKMGRQLTQPRPPRHGAKKPAKFYKENMLALKFPRYQPCGESLEHNG